MRARILIEDWPLEERRAVSEEAARAPLGRRFVQVWPCGTRKTIREWVVADPDEPECHARNVRSYQEVKRGADPCPTHGFGCAAKTAGAAS